ncbi:MAG TPA: NAD(P)H-hydrate dehydratase [Nocardioidaceae bacterium]|nr:NAD(P)H-hydrate dehydratase [Nocardioidaceae bacterium]
MRQAHTVEQVRAAEQVLMSRLPAGTLMQRAATGLAHAVLDYLGGGYGARVLLLVGAGDNGGDALYAGAVLARRGVLVHALLLAPDRVQPAALGALRGAGGRVVSSVSEARRPDLVLDGIVGIGGHGGLRPEATAALAALDGVPVIAVDTPSGVEVDTGEVTGEHVRADLTVTFGTHKVAHLADPAALACGAVHLVDIGLDLPAPTATALQEADVAALLPRPTPAAHKYTRGVVGVRAGSAQYPGAGVLCVAGASTGLAGMVRYLGGAADLVQARHPEVVVGEGRVQAWVVGSGGGADAEQALADALADEVPVVVDADALSHVTGPLGVPALLTPHAGELARLLGAEREEVEARQLHFARLAAQRYDAVVLLKGRHTLVAAPTGEVRATTVGPAWLATAGAGDVLAGLCGSLLAAGLSPDDAGSVGAWVHGAAAVAAGEGGPVTAPDVAAAVPVLCRSLLRQPVR